MFTWPFVLSRRVKLGLFTFRLFRRANVLIPGVVRMQKPIGGYIVVIVVGFNALFARAAEKEPMSDRSAKAHSASDQKATTKDTTTNPESAGDEDIKPEALPKAVRAAIRKRFPKSKIESAEKGVEEGKPIYEASIESQKHKIDVTLSPDGKILSFEKALLPSERPKALIESLNAKYPHATLKLVEELWENDKQTGYEATLNSPDKKTIEVPFDAKGKLIENQKK
jgi:hypothetical protein